MYARLVTIQIQPGKEDDAVRIYRDSIIPAAKDQKGFKSAMLLSDPGTGKGVSVTLWETEKDLKAGESSGYLQQQLAKFGGVFAAPPSRDSFMVMYQT